ncbi:Symplekin [Nymphaea thermarum]|nr:Symplekin [Nymphaea thermarum]
MDAWSRVEVSTLITVATTAAAAAADSRRRDVAPPWRDRRCSLVVAAHRRRRRSRCLVLRCRAPPLLFGLPPMADSSSSSTVHTHLPDVGPARTDHVPVQVTTIQLTKENYSRWSAAITMGIVGRGRIAYVNGRKVEPAANSMTWDTWFLEDNQVKTWIVNSVSSDIQPLILRKKTARDMWIVLEQMYGQKKRKVCVYQLMRDVYGLRQGALSVADFYATLKSKWEDLDYHSDLTWRRPQDQMQYMTKEWENRVFLFLSGLNDDFKNIRSQILNSDESFSIEDVYARVEAEEQRKLVSSGRKGEEQFAFVSRASIGPSRSSRKCTHCKKLGHTIDFCWDLHPEKKNSKGRPSSGKKPVSSVTSPSDGKVSISADQIRELRAYLSQIDVSQADTSDEGSAHTGPALTPVEVLVAIHGINPEKEGIALKKVEQIPLPLLFMRTVIQAIDAFPALVDFVMGILSRLISKQIWQMPKLWVGFLKCAYQTQPHSFNVLLQLPAPQLESALNKHTSLRVPLAAYANQPSIRTSLPRSTLAVLGLVNEKLPPTFMQVSASQSSETCSSVQSTTPT